MQRNILINLVLTGLMLMGCILVLLSSVIFKGFQGYGSGQYVGYVTGAEVRGVLFKTNRVYMKTSLDSSQEDIFCVTDKAVFSQLQERQLTQEKVAVTTKDLGLTFPTECDTEETSIQSVK